MNTTDETANRNRWWKPEALSKSLQQEKLTHLLHLKEMIYLFSLTSPSDRLAHGLNWSGQQQIISLANRGYCPQSNDPSFSLSLKEQPNIFPSPPTRPLLHLLPALNLARHRTSIYPHWKKITPPHCLIHHNSELEGLPPQFSVCIPVAPSSLVCLKKWVLYTHGSPIYVNSWGYMT